MATQSQSLFQPALVSEAIKQAFVKLDPRVMFRNPVMFTVEIGTVVMFLVTIGLLIKPDASQGSFGYNFTVFVVLFLTLLFANFAEAIAEARGKAQADSLRKTRQDTPAKVRQPDGTFASVSSAQLQKGQVFIVEAGEIIPTDGEIIEGVRHGWHQSTLRPHRGARDYRPRRVFLG
jgi:K+-transporting ATPase ATPase B chain